MGARYHWNFHQYLLLPMVLFKHYYWSHKILFKEVDTKENNEAKKDVLIQKHKNRMVFMYIESMFGAGTIRATAWILWIISKFLSTLYIAMTLDIGLCQQSTVCRGEFLGTAESCWIPTLCKPCSWYFPQSFVWKPVCKYPRHDFERFWCRWLENYLA